LLQVTCQALLAELKDMAWETTFFFFLTGRTRCSQLGSGVGSTNYGVAFVSGTQLLMLALEQVVLIKLKAIHFLCVHTVKHGFYKLTTVQGLRC